MVVFEIRDKAQADRLLGYLLYYERSKRFFAEISEDTDEWTCPFIFAGHVRRGIYSIDSVWSGKFVDQRIIPHDRQNLGSILKENGLKEYDEFRLLTQSEGVCAQDELYLVKISERDIVSGIRGRFHRKVRDVMVLKNARVLVFFRDGKSVIADVGKLVGENRLYGNVLRNEEVFRNVSVSPGGQGIEWGEERFISAETLRRAGKESAILYEDVIGFLEDRLADTAETAKILNCSRQYIKQLSDKGRLSPVRATANSSLFLKCDIERED